MAASFELSVFLGSLSVARRPRRILDLGSGFSSYVFRCFAAPTCGVISCDDSPQWLHRTRDFLGAHGFPDAHFDDLATVFQARSKFDLVFLDLGFVEQRVSFLDKALTAVHDGGYIVIDDMHKPSFRPLASGALRRAGFASYSIRKLTLDSFGRYAWLGIAPQRSVQRPHDAG